MLQLNVPISMDGAGCYFKKDLFQSKNQILKSAVVGEQCHFISVGLSRWLVILVGTLQGQVLFWLLFKCQLCQQLQQQYQGPVLLFPYNKDTSALSFPLKCLLRSETAGTWVFLSDVQQSCLLTSSCWNFECTKMKWKKQRWKLWFGL